MVFICPEIRSLIVIYPRSSEGYGQIGDLLYLRFFGLFYFVCLSHNPDGWWTDFWGFLFLFYILIESPELSF